MITRDVEIPEWGCTIQIGAIRPERIERLRVQVATGEADKAWAFAQLILAAAVQPRFEQAHVERLGEKGLPALMRLAQAIQDLSLETYAPYLLAVAPRFSGL